MIRPMSDGRTPNFFIAGTGKAGTTSLYHYLRQHPQIYMSPVKEPCFFAAEVRLVHAFGAADTLAWFRQLPLDRQSKLRAGLAPDREAALLDAWKAGAGQGSSARG